MLKRWRSSSLEGTSRNPGKSKVHARAAAARFWQVAKAGLVIAIPTTHNVCSPNVCVWSGRNGGSQVATGLEHD